MTRVMINIQKIGTGRDTKVGMLIFSLKVS